MLPTYRLPLRGQPTLLLIDRTAFGYRGQPAKSHRGFVCEERERLRPLDSSARPRARWEDVDPDVLTTLGEEITTLFARIGVMTQRLLALIAEFDRLEGWRREGYATCADWLAHRASIDKGTAREKVRVARALA